MPRTYHFDDSLISHLCDLFDNPEFNAIRASAPEKTREIQIGPLEGRLFPLRSPPDQVKN